MPLAESYGNRMLAARLGSVDGPEMVPLASLHIRLRRDALTKIAALAQQSHRSLTGQIAVMLEHYVRLMEQRQQ